MDERRDIELAESFAEVARLLVVERDADATLVRICSAAVSTIRACEHAGLSLTNRRRIEPGLGTDEVPRVLDELQSEVGEGPCIDAIREHAVFRTGQLSGEARWPSFSTRAHAATGVESILAFRLFVEQRTMGALNLYSTRPDAFTDEDVAVGAVFAAHAAIALISSRRERNLAHRAESRDIIGVAKGILMSQRHITDDDAFTMLVDASQQLNVKLRDVAEDVAHTGALPTEPAGRGEATAASVVDTAVAAIVTIDEFGVIQSWNLAAQTLFGYTSAEVLDQNVKMLMPEPYRSQHDGYLARYRETGEPHIIGTSREMPGRHKDGTTFPIDLAVSEMRVGRRLLFAGMAWDISDRKELEAELTQRALHDPLTRLPNRRQFDSELERAFARRQRHGVPVAVLFLDLDRFKTINDTLGHLVGDQLLVQVGQRLRLVVRPSETVARIGGDEFAIVLDDVNQPDAAVHVAERIVDGFRAPFEIDDRSVVATVSIGIAFTGRSGSYDPATLLRHADSALYLAKDRGRNRYEIFDEASGS